MEEKILLKKYIINLEKAFESLKILDRNKNVLDIIDLAKCYLSDARYYFEKGEYATGISCIAYGEGLLDSLRKLGKIDFKWPGSRKIRRVVVGGTFDIIHPGHLYLLRRAKKYGYVIVIVARDSTVKKLKNKVPIIPEKQRLEIIRSIKYVDEAYLGYKNINILKVIEKYRPDIILLGPDQIYLEHMIRKIVSEKGLKIEIKRLKKKYDKYMYSSTSDIIKHIIEEYGE